LSSTPFT